MYDNQQNQHYTNYPYIQYQAQMNAFAEVYKLVGNAILMFTKVFTR